MAWRNETMKTASGKMKEKRQRQQTMACSKWNNRPHGEMKRIEIRWKLNISRRRNRLAEAGSASEMAKPYQKLWPEAEIKLLSDLRSRNEENVYVQCSSRSREEMTQLAVADLSEEKQKYQWRNVKREAVKMLCEESPLEAILNEETIKKSAWKHAWQKLFRGWLTCVAYLAGWLARNSAWLHLTCGWLWWRLYSGWLLSQICSNLPLCTWNQRSSPKHFCITCREAALTLD